MQADVKDLRNAASHLYGVLLDLFRIALACILFGYIDSDATVMAPIPNTRGRGGPLSVLERNQILYHRCIYISHVPGTAQSQG